MADVSQSLGGWLWRKIAGASEPAPVDDGGPPTGQQFRTYRIDPPSTLEARRRKPRFVPSVNEAADRIEPGPRVQPSASWVYQLQKIKVEEIAVCPADVAVIDSSPDGDPVRPFTPAEVERMKTRPDGSRRVLISYMSIGEANSGRFYWRKNWLDSKGRTTSIAPHWLYKPNTGWSGAWKVRFWEKEWQGIIFGHKDSCLDRIIDQGFDGVYLDIIDGWVYWFDDPEAKPNRSSAGQDMVTFVSRIAHHARVTRNKPGFFVVPQNGEGLLRDPAYRAVISAIGKEDILFDQVGQVDDNPRVKPRPETMPEGESSVQSIIADLNLGLNENPPVPVIAVEYLRDQPKDVPAQAPTIARMRSLRFVPHLAKRDLANLSLPILPGDMPMA